MSAVFFSSRRRHTRFDCDWSSDVCSSDLFADLDLTQKQVAALWLVADHPGIAQTGVAQRMRMDRATTMAIVNRLEAKGYLARSKSHIDGRKQELKIGRAHV